VSYFSNILSYSHDYIPEEAPSFANVSFEFQKSHYEMDINVEIKN
jgi:hypothetical protein